MKKNDGGKKEVRAKLDAYQVLHEQMNEAFINGTTSSIKKEEARSYMFSIGVNRRDVFHTKYKKKRPYAFGMWSDDKAFTLFTSFVAAAAISISFFLAVG
ncbi:hypothetical protein BsIDN1_43130 [Bacillus safensis]|uniref:Uncharacterized protein n=1 Tax=Bacillus safensis TaxID=561879 RepID=A0A5S9MCU5_BACIA|nr:hypothetical protein BsIDN1_43130 [Bacillus safensis]